MTARRLDGRLIRARLEAGEFNMDLAREYDVCSAAISNAARRAGYEWDKNVNRITKRHNRKTTPAQRAAIVSRVRAGEKRSDLAREYGVSLPRICTIVKADLRSLRVSSPSSAGTGAAKSPPFLAAPFLIREVTDA